MIKEINKVLIKLSNMQLIPSDYVLNKIFFNSFNPNDKAITEELGSYGYGKHNLILNMENSFLFLVLSVILTVFVIKVNNLNLSNFPKIQTMVGKAYSKVVYSVLLRFLIESYLDYTLLLFISL
jgi:hypothetical protein